VIMPSDELPPATPFTLQVTAVEGAPLAVMFAVKACPASVDTVAVGGKIPTTMSSASVIVTEVVASGCALLDAVKVTLGGDDRTFGAVYKPPGEIVPAAALPPATPPTDHVTLLSEVPVTVT